MTTTLVWKQRRLQLHSWYQKKIWVKKFSPNINHFKGAFCAIRLTIGDAVNQSTTDKARSAWRPMLLREEKVEMCNIEFINSHQKCWKQLQHILAPCLFSTLPLLLYLGLCSNFITQAKTKQQKVEQVLPNKTPDEPQCSINIVRHYLFFQWSN